MKTTTVMSLLLPALVGCSAESPNLVMPFNAVLVPFEVIDEIVKSGHSDIPEPQRTVLRSQEEFNQFWLTLGGGLNPPPNSVAPTFDFEVSMVLVAGLGTRSNSGFGVVVDQVGREGDKTYVQVREIQPGPNCINLHIITTPITAVLVPRSDEVEFLESKTVLDCSELDKT